MLPSGLAMKPSGDAAMWTVVFMEDTFGMMAEKDHTSGCA